MQKKTCGSKKKRKKTKSRKHQWMETAVSSLLVDRYQRVINYLRISVTDRCNLRCLYCMPEEGLPLKDQNEILSYEELFRLARLSAEMGITRIRLTGGEPLVRKGIVDFVSSLANIKGVEDLSLTTNGVLLAAYAGSLARAGLNRVNISLDSLKQDRYSLICRSDRLQQVWQGIQEAENHGLTPIKINFVAIKGINDDEVLKLAKLTLLHPWKIRFIEFMPTGQQSFWGKDKYIPMQEIKEKIESFAPLIPILNNNSPHDGNGPAARFHFPDAAGEVGFISAMSCHFCDSCNRLRITAEGKLRTCLFSDDEIDLRQPLRQGASDEEIMKILKEGSHSKPKGHYMANEEHFKKCQRSMSQIGG